MKNYINKIICVLCLSFAASNASAAVITLQPESDTATVGNVVQLNVVISGLGNLVANSISTFDFNLSFDSTVLAYQSTTFGNYLDVLGMGSMQSAEEQSQGVLNVSELSFDSPADLHSQQPGSFVMATLSFKALTVGSSGFGFTLNALGDAVGNSLDATTAVNNLIVRTAVSEPSALALFIGALLVCMGRIRRSA